MKIPLLMKADWSSSRMKSLDLGLSVAVLLVGLVMMNKWIIGIGVLGLIFSFINPMGRLQKFMNGFVRKSGR